MPEMNSPISSFLSLVAQTASFRARALPREERYFDERLSGAVSEELRQLSDHAEYLQIDGWHFLEPTLSAAITSQMIGNLEFMPEHGAVEPESVGVGVRAEYWSQRWIPIFSIEHELLCIDLDPSTEGHMGQLVRVSVDGAQRRVVACSLTEFCQRVVEAFESGDLRFEDFGAGRELVARDGYVFFVW